MRPSIVTDDYCWLTVAGHLAVDCIDRQLSAKNNPLLRCLVLVGDLLLAQGEVGEAAHLAQPRDPVEEVWLLLPLLSSSIHCLQS